MEEQAIDDAALVRETLAGHQSSFQLLVERHEARVFALLRHYVKNPVELEDLAQETFLKAFKRLDSFEGQASFYTWIYRIAVNTAKKFLQERKRRSPRPMIPRCSPIHSKWTRASARRMPLWNARRSHARPKPRWPSCPRSSALS